MPPIPSVVVAGFLIALEVKPVWLVVGCCEDEPPLTTDTEVLIPNELVAGVFTGPFS